MQNPKPIKKWSFPKKAVVDEWRKKKDESYWKIENLCKKGLGLYLVRRAAGLPASPL